MPDLATLARLAADYTAAWNSGSAAAVAGFYAEATEIVINQGEPLIGRAQAQDMAAEFFAAVSDLALTCDDIRLAGSHALYVFTYTGLDAASGNPLTIKGWEDWTLDANLKIAVCLGWHDAADYAAQAAAKT